MSAGLRCSRSSLQTASKANSSPKSWPALAFGFGFAFNQPVSFCLEGAILGWYEFFIYGVVDNSAESFDRMIDRLDIALFAFVVPYKD